jgi:hypothetical protein
MEVAIIGWGSLIWCPGALQIKSCWHRDGPALRIEFARVSKDKRLTLVIHPGSNEQQTLWATAASQELEAVRANLRDREGTSSRLIHSGTAAGEFSDGVSVGVRKEMAEWLGKHQEIDACVWTGLASNWRDEKRGDFSVASAIQHLKDLPELARPRAQEYIQNTPSQIQTAVRIAIREQLGWVDAELSPVLFATD